MTEEERQEAQRRIHEAIGSYLDEGEIAVAWILTVDVAGPDDTRYLAHRAGGGIDGTDRPMSWHALGMMKAGVMMAERQVSDATWPLGDDDDEHGDDD